MFFFKKKKAWRTVAIDTRYGWHQKSNTDIKGDHILVFQVCDNTGERQAFCEDADDAAREYGDNHNSSVAESHA